VCTCNIGFKCKHSTAHTSELEVDGHTKLAAFDIGKVYIDRTSENFTNTI